MASPPPGTPPPPRRRRTTVDAPLAPPLRPVLHPRSKPGRAPGIIAVLAAAAPLAVAAVGMIGDQRPATAALASQPAPPAAPAGPPPILAADGDLAPPPPNSVIPQCLTQFAIDLPKHRGDDVGRRQTIICRRGYILSYNVDTRSPDWVVERLEPSELRGTASRGNRFLHDPALPAGIDADNPDFLKTGFDKGHQAPAGDSKFDQTIMDESFYFTNMSPQRGIGMNRGAWKFLEETTRSWVLCGGHPDLYVITGPIYGTLAGNPATIGDPPIAVPRAYYKIVYDPVRDLAVGFVLPNTRIGSRINLQDYVVRITDIETETGLNFFRSMDQRRQAEIKDSPGVAWGHTGTCPGDMGD